ncbi:hypothetical protein NDU88_002004 [Pleurodeles waltl]|uniref:Uncharacterized protein n=1 Tax=Pleurodeles waltl TaxID=8319 RepID=A0AAV7M4R6_PLEWA|nr:hypothetical protein NDU88_002004 [Pleurodeles waltl]
MLLVNPPSSAKVHSMVVALQVSTISKEERKDLELPIMLEEEQPLRKSPGTNSSLFFKMYLSVLALQLLALFEDAKKGCSLPPDLMEVTITVVPKPKTPPSRLK